MKVGKLIKLLSLMPKNMEIFNEQGIEIKDCIKCKDSVIIINSEIVGKCKKCGGPVVRELNNYIDYPFFCPNCLENMYSFECNLNKNGKYIENLYNKSWINNLPIHVINKYDFYFPKDLINKEKRFFAKSKNGDCIVEIEIISLKFTIKDFSVYVEMVYRDCEHKRRDFTGVCKDNKIPFFSNERNAITNTIIHHDKINMCKMIMDMGYELEFVNSPESIALVEYYWDATSVKKIVIPFSNIIISNFDRPEMSISVGISVSQGRKLYKTIEDCKNDNKIIVKKF